MKTFIVKLCSKSVGSEYDSDADYLTIDFEISAESDYDAANKAINYFNATYWSQATDNADKIKSDFNKLKSVLGGLPNDLKCFKELESVILNEYKRILRKYYEVDITIEEFNKMCISEKLDYLYQTGCELDYIVYPKKHTHKEKVKL